MLKIVPYPHAALRYQSRPVATIDEKLRTLVREMFDRMYEARGIGLAANQVGVPLQFFILNLTADPEQKEKEMVLINPEIVKRHGSIEGEEGCLSFPGVYAPVRRARKIRVQAFGLNAEPIDLEAEDLLSRAIQHETDHLHGKLFIDHLIESARQGILVKVHEIEQGFRHSQAHDEYPSDAAIKAALEHYGESNGEAGTP